MSQTNTSSNAGTYANLPSKRELDEELQTTPNAWKLMYKLHIPNFWQKTYLGRPMLEITLHHRAFRLDSGNGKKVLI